MVWKQLSLTPSHLTYILLSAFLILYALFSQFIRNRLHLAEPPLATLFGILVGPAGLNIISPREWIEKDSTTEEITRIVVGIQVFAIGLELPRRWIKKHWRSLAMLLGPVMTLSYLVTALLVYYIAQTELLTAFVISACLAPTDPVLAASIIGDSHFSERIPKRLRDLLGAESGANDGVSFPFLYIPVYLLLKKTAGEAMKEWFLITILYECLGGLAIGCVIGWGANRWLKTLTKKEMIDPAAFLAFYLLLALFSIGVGCTLGVDDFLVSFGAGNAFSYDGWFSKRIKETHLPAILDLILNASFFIYFGATIPWKLFTSDKHNLDLGMLIGLSVAILLLRRVPALLICWKGIPEIKSFREALFCGWFGPMGVGAIFLSITARSQLESGTSTPLPKPPGDGPFSEAIVRINPIIMFIVFTSILVHGFSTGFISVYGHFMRHQDHRADAIGAEQDLLDGFVGSDYGSMRSEEAADDH